MNLLHELYKAHDAVALRGNLSHQALVLSAVGSGDYFKALSAALLTLGGVHAPLRETYKLIASDSATAHVARMLDMGRKVPGWGNSFVKGRPDEAWTACDALLRQEDPGLHAKITSMTAVFHEFGKKLYPNPSCYTAAVAIHYQVEADAVGELLVRGRLAAWTREFLLRRQEGPCLS